MWRIVSTKERIQEFREESSYHAYKKKQKCVDLYPVNAVLTTVKIKDLIPTVSFHGRIYSAVEESIRRIGLKDPFLIHFVTNVPKDFKQGLFIKSGNNRFYVCKKLGIEEAPCIVVNLSGRFEDVDQFIQGEVLESKEDVSKLFHTDKVHVVMRDGKICNARIAKWQKISNMY